MIVFISRERINMILLQFILQVLFNFCLIAITPIIYFCITEEHKYWLIPLFTFLIIIVSRFLKLFFLLRKDSYKKAKGIFKFIEFIGYWLNRLIPSLILLQAFSLWIDIYLKQESTDKLAIFFDKLIVYVKTILNEAICNCNGLDKGVDIIGISIFFIILFIPLYSIYKTSNKLFDKSYDVFKYYKYLYEFKNDRNNY